MKKFPMHIPIVTYSIIYLIHSNIWLKLKFHFPNNRYSDSLKKKHLHKYTHTHTYIHTHSLTITTSFVELRVGELKSCTEDKIATHINVLHHTLKQWRFSHWNRRLVLRSASVGVTLSSPWSRGQRHPGLGSRTSSFWQLGKIPQYNEPNMACHCHGFVL